MASACWSTARVSVRSAGTARWCESPSFHWTAPSKDVIAHEPCSSPMRFVGGAALRGTRSQDPCVSLLFPSFANTLYTSRHGIPSAPTSQKQRSLVVRSPRHTTKILYSLPHVDTSHLSKHIA